MPQTKTLGASDGNSQVPGSNGNAQLELSREECRTIIWAVWVNPNGVKLLATSSTERIC
jgi:hypothetical protein